MYEGTRKQEATHSIYQSSPSLSGNIKRILGQQTISSMSSFAQPVSGFFVLYYFKILTLLSIGITAFSVAENSCQTYHILATLSCAQDPDVFFAYLGPDVYVALSSKLFKESETFDL